MSKRVLLGVGLWVLGGAAAGWAGDLTDVRQVGFSENGRYFAYEQFGRQDASGFPYSRVSFVDTQTNGPAADDAFVLHEQEDAELLASRTEAAGLARPVLQRLGIVEGNTGGWRIHRLGSAVAVIRTFGPLVDRLDFATHLEGIRSHFIEAPQPDVGGDEDGMGPIKRLELTYRAPAADGAGASKPRRVYADTTTVARARGARLFSIGGVVVYEVPQTHVVRVVVFVDYRKPGFEGPDQRTFAVGFAVEN